MEFLVGTVHQTVPILSLLFEHTARRSYRLGCGVKYGDPKNILWPRSRAGPRVTALNLVV